MHEVPVQSLAKCPTDGGYDLSPLLGPVWVFWGQSSKCTVDPAGPEHRGKAPKWNDRVRRRKTASASWAASRSEGLHAAGWGMPRTTILWGYLTYTMGVRWLPKTQREEQRIKALTPQDDK